MPVWPLSQHRIIISLSRVSYLVPRLSVRLLFTFGAGARRSLHSAKTLRAKSLSDAAIIKGRDDYLIFFKSLIFHRRGSTRPPTYEKHGRSFMERRSLDHLRELPRAGSIGTFMIIPWVLLAHSGRRQAPSFIPQSSGCVPCRSTPFGTVWD